MVAWPEAADTPGPKDAVLMLFGLKRLKTVFLCHLVLSPHLQIVFLIKRLNIRKPHCNMSTIASAL